MTNKTIKQKDSRMNIKEADQNESNADPYTIELFGENGEKLGHYHSKYGLVEPGIDHAVEFDSLADLLLHLTQSAKNYERFTVVFEESGDSYDSRERHGVYLGSKDITNREKDLIEISRSVSKATHLEPPTDSSYIIEITTTVS